MIRAKKMKKMIKRIVPRALLGILFAIAIIKSVQALIGFWHQKIQPVLQPTLVECEVHHVYSQELVRSIQAAVQEHAKDSLIICFKPQNLYEKLKEQFTCLKSMSYELQAPKMVKITLYGTTPKVIVNENFILGDKRRLFALSDFQDFDCAQLPCISIASAWCEKKLAKQAYDFVQRVPISMWNRFKILFTSPEVIILTPTQNACPFKIIADVHTFFNENKFEQVNSVFNDLIKKEQITQRMLASKECNVVFDVRFDNRVYVKFLNKPRRGGR